MKARVSLPIQNTGLRDRVLEALAVSIVDSVLRAESGFLSASAVKPRTVTEIVDFRNPKKRGCWMFEDVVSREAFEKAVYAAIKEHGIETVLIEFYE
jgi:hypothetical protein